jgi:hypothetical protein
LATEALAFSGFASTIDSLSQRGNESLHGQATLADRFSVRMQRAIDGGQAQIVEMVDDMFLILHYPFAKQFHRLQLD